MSNNDTQMHKQFIGIGHVWNLDIMVGSQWASLWRFQTKISKCFMEKVSENEGYHQSNYSHTEHARFRKLNMALTAVWLL
jgi:hypothetical protein